MQLGNVEIRRIETERRSRKAVGGSRPYQSARKLNALDANDALIECDLGRPGKLHRIERDAKENKFILKSPDVKVHDDVIKTIREQLNELRNDVETKVKRSSGAVFKV